MSAIAVLKVCGFSEEAARKRQIEGGRAKGSGKFPEGGETRDKLAAYLGVSGRTLEKAEAVVEAAAAESAGS